MSFLSSLLSRWSDQSDETDYPEFVVDEQHRMDELLMIGRIIQEYDGAESQRMHLDHETDRRVEHITIDVLVDCMGEFSFRVQGLGNRTAQFTAGSLVMVSVHKSCDKERLVDLAETMIKEISEELVRHATENCPW